MVALPEMNQFLTWVQWGNGIEGIEAGVIDAPDSDQTPAGSFEAAQENHVKLTWDYKDFHPQSMEEARKGPKEVSPKTGTRTIYSFAQIPTYLAFQGRVINKSRIQRNPNEPPYSLWRGHYHTLGEELTVSIPAGRYDNVKGGLYVVDIQGAGFVVPRPAVLRTQIQEGQLLQCGRYSVTPEDKDLLFGERKAYRDRHEIPIQLFASFEAFEEWSRTLDIGSLCDVSRLPAYAVVRPYETVCANPSAIKPVNEQIENPDLIILAGGKEPLRRMLDQRMPWQFGPERISSFGFHHERDVLVPNSGNSVLVAPLEDGIYISNFHPSGWDTCLSGINYPNHSYPYQY